MKIVTDENILLTKEVDEASTRLSIFATDLSTISGNNPANLPKKQEKLVEEVKRQVADLEKKVFEVQQETSTVTEVVNRLQIA